MNIKSKLSTSCFIISLFILSGWFIKFNRDNLILLIYTVVKIFPYNLIS